MKEPLELRGSLFAKKREREAWTGLERVWLVMQVHLGRRGRTFVLPSWPGANSISKAFCFSRSWAGLSGMGLGLPLPTPWFTTLLYLCKTFPFALSEHMPFSVPPRKHSSPEHPLQEKLLDSGHGR